MMRLRQMHPNTSRHSRMTLVGHESDEDEIGGEHTFSADKNTPPPQGEPSIAWGGLDSRKYICEVMDAIRTVADQGSKIGELLAKVGNQEDCDRLDGLLDRLAKFDRGLDIDRRALDQTKQKHLEAKEDRPVLLKHFKKIRIELEVQNPGKHQPYIGQIRERLAQAKQQKMATQTDGNGEGAEVQMNERDSNSEDEMEMLSFVLSDKDPISKERIAGPVKNSICGHVYDLQTVEGFIKDHRQRKMLCQCPVRMCTNKKQLDMAQMIPFPEFFNMIRRARSRSKSRGPPRRLSHH